ncbi:MAG: extracellular solute-binding protein [Oscillospiraceae bacterium]|nr:extracellular solute-binding protein [Oscillospiraceae bacterium]
MKNKKIFLILLTIILFISGCSKNSSSTINSDKNHENYISLFYKTEEYPSDNFMYLEDVVKRNDFLYEFGLKNLNEDDGKCTIYSLENSSEINVNTYVPYDEMMDAEISNDKLYMLYMYNNIFNLSCLDIKSEKTEKTISLEYFPQTILCTDNMVLVLSDDINSREVLLYRYDLNLEPLQTINLSNITDKEGFAGSCFSMCYSQGMLFFFGTNRNGSLYLYCMNEDMDILYSRELNDMPGRASDIFVEDDYLVLCSYDDSGRYINYMEMSDGTVKDRYEIPDASKIYSGYSSEVKLCRTNLDCFYYNLKENRKENVDVPDCLSYENYCYQSGKSYIIFPNMRFEIHSVCQKFDSVHNKKGEIDLGSSVIACGITEDNMVYALSNYDQTEYELSLYNDEKQVKSIKIEKDFDDKYSSFIITDNMLLLSLFDTDNNNKLVRYDINGASEECIYSCSDGSYITQLFKSKDTVYFSCIENRTEIKIMKLSEDTVYELNALKDIRISNVFHGDDQYDFYYESGSAIYGYDDKEEKSDKIIDLVDSGLIYKIDSFSKISEDNYFCRMVSDTDRVYLKLTKADDDELERFNNRKKIIVAGNNIKENISLSEKIIQFNRENLDYYITVRDYSTDDKMISNIGHDVANSEIPDLYILDKDFDFMLLSEKNALLDLTTLIESDPTLNLNDLFSSVLDMYSSDNEIYGIMTSFNLKGIVLGNTDENIPYDYSAFLEKIKTDDIHFKYANEKSLWGYMVISKAHEFIDFENAKCNFTSDDFINLLKYIPDAINDNGTAGIHEIYDFSSKGYLSALYNNDYMITDVSATGKSRSAIDTSNSFGFAVSSVSDNPDGAWSFIKMFLSEEYQNQIQEFPILRKSFENKFSEEIKYNGHSGSIYTPDLSEPIDFTLDISENDKEFIIELIESASHLNLAGSKIESIIKENIDLYIETKQTAEETASNIQSKVGLYLSEMLNKQ